VSAVHAPPAVLVLARAPAAGRSRSGLREALGDAGAAALERVLLGRAGAWAQAVAPGRVHVAVAPPGAGHRLAPLLGEATYFDQQGDGAARRLAHATERVLADAGGPLLVVGTAVATLGPVHAAGALDDLGAGCDVSVGPTTGGGCYLLGLRATLPGLSELDSGRSAGPVALLARALSAAAGVRLGMLRAERELRTVADARALLADPRCPGDVREALRSCAPAP
jgi:glycosyltransferase A (GT-A) superfamily protein (DUF2064 family)